jgi:type I restriction enzyme S subunit
MKSEWRKVRLGDVANFRTGKLNSNAAIENGIYPFFTCSPETLKINDYAFDQKAILLAGNNADGNFTVKYFEGKFNAYQRTYVIDTFSDVDMQYLFYALKICLNQFKLLSQGTSTRFLTLKILNDFTIPLPPFPTQRAMAATLSCLDDKIEMNNRINANLEAQAQAIFKSWFVDFEPFRDGKFVDSELGRIPKGWRVGTLGEIAKITSGKRPPSRTDKETIESFIPIVGASSIMGYTQKELYNSPILVIGRVGTHGIVQRFRTKCWASDNTLVIMSNYYEFVYQILKTINYEGINRGTTQPLITQADINKNIIIIPDDNSLYNFESHIGALMNYHHSLEQQSRAFAAIRDALLPKLMSGEVEIAVEVEEE